MHTRTSLEYEPDKELTSHTGKIVLVIEAPFFKDGNNL